MSKVKANLNNKTILVTGSPGFIGANLVLRLLKDMSGGTVISLDNMNDYYDPKIKEYRLGLIEKAAESSPVHHVFVKGSIANKELPGCADTQFFTVWKCLPGSRYDIGNLESYENVQKTYHGITR